MERRGREREGEGREGEGEGEKERVIYLTSLWNKKCGRGYKREGETDGRKRTESYFVNLIENVVVVFIVCILCVQVRLRVVWWSTDAASR